MKKKIEIDMQRPNNAFAIYRVFCGLTTMYLISSGVSLILSLVIQNFVNISNSEWAGFGGDYKNLILWIVIFISFIYLINDIFETRYIKLLNGLSLIFSILLFFIIIHFCRYL